MDRRQVLGVAGALALAVVMGVGANATEKSKVVEAAKACCGGDTCCPVCRGDTCCGNSITGKVSAAKTVKAAKPSCCLVTAVKSLRRS